MDDEHHPLAYKAGDGLPLVLRGGKAVAARSHRFERDRMRVTVTPFEPDDRAEYIDECIFTEAGRVLGATDSEVVIEEGTA